MEKEFIPVWEWCKKYGKPKQTIYRWIREKRLEGRYKKVEKVVNRILMEDSDLS